MQLYDDIAGWSQRAERAAVDYLVTRYSGPGNPMKTQILRRGSWVATKVPFAPQTAIMNSVHGLSDPADLPAVVAFYAATNQPCWLGLTCARASKALGRGLTAHGFAPESHSAILAAPAAAIEAEPVEGVTIERVDQAGLDTFLEVLARGFNSAESSIAPLVKNQSFWCQVPAWRLLLARVGGRRAGAGVLSIGGGIGYLAAASTLPAMRGRGVHRALIAARVSMAAEEGCELVAGQAAFGSQSHKNQLRAGLQLIDIRQDWRHPG